MHCIEIIQVYGVNMDYTYDVDLHENTQYCATRCGHYCAVVNSVKSAVGKWSLRRRAPVPGTVQLVLQL